jgi:hypothetical protein
MTVRLLVPAYGKQANALYTGTAATERALIDAGQADNQLDASFDYPAFLDGKSMAPNGAVDQVARGLARNGVLGGLGQLSTAVSRVMNRTGRARMGFVADSTGVGSGAIDAPGTTLGANPSSPPNVIRANSAPQQFAALMNSAGIPTRADAIFGNGNLATPTTAAFVSYDPGHTFGADWSIYAGSTLGGSNFSEVNTGTTSWVTKKWDYAADTFDIYYFTAGGGGGFGQFSVTDAAGTLAVIDSNTGAGAPPGSGGGAYARTTVKRDTASKLPISIQRTGGGQVLVAAIVPYDSNSPRLEIWNMGWAGAKTGDWNNPGSSGWKSFYALGAVEQPDCWHLELMFNDVFNNIPVETSKANLLALATKLTAQGVPVFLGTPHNAYAGNVGFQLTPAHYAAINAVAATTGAFPIDYTTIPLAPADFFDVVHLVKSGYGKKAAMLAAAVLAKL